MRHIYLDFNATTPVAPSVLEAMQSFLKEHYGNPSSRHALGRACGQAIEDARERVAEMIGADPGEIIFTSGGTESNNLAIIGAMLDDQGFEGHCVISSIEHPAVFEPARFLQKMGCSLTVVGTDKYGQVDPSEVAAALRPDTVLVSVMHANNEIGTIQPIREIADVCRAHGVLFHSDAAQSAGKIRTDVDELGVDLLTVAGHKLYAPKGIGALYVRGGTPLRPVLHGAGHEQGLRPGTENVPYIVGLGQAAKLAARGLDESSHRLRKLRDRLFQLLSEAIGPGLTSNGPDELRLPNTLSVNFPGVNAVELLERAPEICASTGAACHSGETRLSPTLESIGISPETAQGTVRLSLGWNSSGEEVERAADVLIGAWESLVAFKSD